MKAIILCWIFTAGIFFSLQIHASVHYQGTYDSLLFEFKNPSDFYKPHVWWHWMNGHISAEAITKDLESMKAAGIGGFTLFNASEGTTAKGPVDYMSEKWWQLYRHTVYEAERLGLDMGIHNGAGWSSTGGPWVRPEGAMQEVAWTEIHLEGPMTFDGHLPEPLPAIGLERDMRRDPEVNKRYYVPRDSVKGYFHDIAVFAFPTLQSDQTLEPVRLTNWWEKAGFAKMKSKYVPQKEDVSEGDKIITENLLNISAHLAEDGKLYWEVPAGKWTILRMGYQPTGRQNHPAPPQGRGLEIDKFSREAVDAYWQNSISKMLDAAGSAKGKPLTRLLIDSYEVGHQNWNKTFHEDFISHRGYDLLKFLPAITGRVVDDVELTERFLWDYRKTINDLIQSNYYKRFRELCHENGLIFAAEAYGAFGNTDDISASEIPDIPLTEWWTFRSNNYADFSSTARVASSAAHTQGKKIVDSEAFTGPPEKIFEAAPRDFKIQGDYFFTLGVNRFSYHNFTHDPYEHLPGMGLGTYGSRFDRRNTWWSYANAYFAYVTRCQYLLQQGDFIADVLYFTGEDAPKTLPPKHNLKPTIPYGYDYDVCSAETLMKALVEENRIILPGGMKYRLLILSDVQQMTMPLLEKLESLMRDGVTILGAPPQGLPGMESGTALSARFDQIKSRIWPEAGSQQDQPKYGSVYRDESTQQVFQEMGLAPDFGYSYAQTDVTLPEGENEKRIQYIHRRHGQIDIYFVSNQNDFPVSLNTSFRVSGKIPELWNPMTGTTEMVSIFSDSLNDYTNFRIQLEAMGSVFVVFRENSTSDAENVFTGLTFNGKEEPGLLKNHAGEFFILAEREGNYAVQTKEHTSITGKVNNIPNSFEIKGPWRLSFSKGWGTPLQINMPELASLTSHPHYDIKHYSGTTTYRTRFHLKKSFFVKNQVVILDLGEVNDLAVLLINGDSVATLWKPPYAFEVTNFLKPGKNDLEIKVINVWHNRVVGDQKYPDDLRWTDDTGSTAKGRALQEFPEWLKDESLRPSTGRKTFVSWEWPHLKEKELLPSGLIGPVRITSMIKIPVP
ncbi:MAG: hypothetical protein JJU28_05315 [Cyclobacteriaceae bacterium]|nr:hypothetical protein [Cyclobacteriaceae bacterium]